MLFPLSVTYAFRKAFPPEVCLGTQVPSSNMLFKSLAMAAAAAAPAVVGQELMRFGCSQLTIDRIDPLVEPGNMPSAHMHQIIGGNSFNASSTS